MRDGGTNSEEFDLFGTGGAGGAGGTVSSLDGGGIAFGIWLCGGSASDSRSRLMSGLGSVVDLPIPQCCASMDLLSSMGVKMLRVLAGAGF